MMSVIEKPEKIDVSKESSVAETTQWDFENLGCYPNPFLII